MPESPKSATGMFEQPGNPSDPVDIALHIRLKGIDARLDKLEAQVELVVDLLRESVTAKICEHTVKVMQNENGQLKWVVGGLLIALAILYGVPMALTSEGITLFGAQP